MKFPDSTFYKFSDACGVYCPNFEAEIATLTSAVEHCHLLFERGEREACDIVIFTDSESALQALGDVHSSEVTM